MYRWEQPNALAPNHQADQLVLDALDQAGTDGMTFNELLDETELGVGRKHHPTALSSRFSSTSTIMVGDVTTPAPTFSSPPPHSVPLLTTPGSIAAPTT